MDTIKLTYLTEDQNLIALCSTYWELDPEGNFKAKVAQVAKEFKVPSTGLSKLIAEYCTAYSTTIHCEQCKKPYSYSSRADFLDWQRSASNRSWKCDECLAKDRLVQAEKQRHLEEHRRQIIEENFPPTLRRVVSPHALSLENAVYLLSLIRLGAAENFAYLYSLELVEDDLAPTDDLKYTIVRQLHDNGLIYVHPKSPVSAFKFEGEEIKAFYLDKTFWALPLLEGAEDSVSFVDKLENIFRSKDWSPNWFANRLDLWEKVALHECLQYLNISLTDHGFAFNPGDKTVLTLRNVLKDYSVAQAFNFIWRAAKDAASLYVRKALPKNHAANTVVGSIQRQAERAKVEGWDIKPYRRDRRCPQSMISMVLFNAALQIGDRGFNEPPSFPEEDFLTL